MSETKVLCIPTSVFEEFGAFQGVTTDVERYFPILEHPALHFHPRSLAETDPTRKQLISYHLVVRDGHLLEYVRSKQAAEGRLIGKRSIGIGGHIDEIIKEGATESLLTPQEHFVQASGREIDEELEINSSGGITNSIVGFVNDDLDDVGRVHLGVIHRINLASFSRIHSMDPCIKLEGFRDLANIRRGERYEHRHVKLEGWSDLIVCSPDIDQLLFGHSNRPHPFFTPAK